MPDIEKVSVTLTGEQVAQLKSAVDSGEYATTSEAIREALREWQWKRELRTEEMGRLRHLWEEGIASGPAVEVDMKELRQRARQRVKKVVRKAA
jgi:antitoxin ParD1/3/4